MEPRYDKNFQDIFQAINYLIDKDNQETDLKERKKLDLNKKKNNQQKGFTVQEVQEKLAAYCAYQDRCQWEVENKLKEFNLIPEAMDHIIIYLIQNKFLNEERFAKSYARGKFYQKNWGKNKIKMELKKRQIPGKLIETGMKEIDANDYFEILQKLYLKKQASLSSERESFKKKQKITNFLIQKGFEYHLIEEVAKLIND